MKKEPIPTLLRIIPRSVDQCNTSKSGIDIMSQYLSRVKISFKIASPLQQYITRILLMAVVNLSIATRASSNVHNILQAKNSKQVKNCEQRLGTEIFYSQISS